MQLRVRPVMDVVVSLAVLVGGACSRSDGGGGDGADAGGPGPAADARVTYDTAPIGAMIPQAQAPAAFARLMCEKIYGCCAVADQLRLPVDDQAGCEVAFTDLLNQVNTEIAAAISAGRVRYDGQALADCLRSYQTTGCSAATPMGTVISYRECAYLTPLVDGGQPCQSHFECKAGFCAGGVCTARKADGDACGQDDECPVRCKPTAPRTCVAGPPVDLCQAL
jgi:hypothetical protein